MATELLRRTEIYSCDTEEEYEDLVATAMNSGGDLTKKMVEIKVKKAKGEIVAEKKKITLQVDFADIWDGYGENE